MKIEALAVEFAFRNRPVLKGLDFSADTGDVLAVLGPNGVGKSTLFRCLLGLLRPQKGVITIDGKALSGMRGTETAGYIAYIPQSVSPVFNYTVLELVLMGTANRLGRFRSPGKKEEDEATVILESLGIDHLKHRGCGQISGGERQLALLARALIQNARVLIMDEPTANLDYGNSYRVMERISSLANSGYTVIFSTHDPNQAFMHASRALVMKDGCVLATGAPDEVLSKELLSQVYNVNVDVHKVPYSGGEVLISLPSGRIIKEDE